MLRLRDWDGAAEAIRDALRFDGLPPRETARAGLVIGRIHTRLGEVEQAEAAFQRVLDVEDPAVDPWLVSHALMDRSRLRLATGRYEGAMEDLRRVLALGLHAHPRHRIEAEECLRRHGASVEVPPEVMGAEANSTGSPIGGGEGYAETFTAGDTRGIRAHHMTFFDVVNP